MKPNENTCPVCLGLPGALPVPNKQAVLWTMKIAQALNCQINEYTQFDRKHYFYPDLPKGYQISQYDNPIGKKGALSISMKSADNKIINREFGITRVHLEEDTGKLSHSGSDTLVDFNRSGVPLVEIVTEPCFENSVDVKIFLEELHAIIKTLDVSTCDMEKGSMRLEPNISLSNISDFDKRMKNLPQYKVEVKNINSFNYAKKAIDFELVRQAKILDTGKNPQQETRGYNETKGETYSQRSKENAQDYRYFPEPDIPPIRFKKEDIDRSSSSLPELPNARLMRFINQYSLKFDDAFILSRGALISKFYENIIDLLKRVDLSKLSENVSSNIPQAVANAIINKKIKETESADNFISEFFIINEKHEINDAELEENILNILNEFKPQVAQFKAGKQGLLGFFIGKVMTSMKGKANPSLIRKKVEDALTRS
jgi:aspartyl-tRNA(Asn)/glutamyl-tRNA(Gln) amidotransferase subunit B